MSDGVKGAKIGRHARGGSMAAYNATRRDLINKAKRIKKQAKAVAKAVARKAAKLVKKAKGKK
jgi:hypothetical protein